MAARTEKQGTMACANAAPALSSAELASPTSHARLSQPAWARWSQTKNSVASAASQKNGGWPCQSAPMIGTAAPGEHAHDHQHDVCGDGEHGQPGAIEPGPRQGEGLQALDPVSIGPTLAASSRRIGRSTGWRGGKRAARPVCRIGLDGGRPRSGGPLRLHLLGGK
jgi:hypothetical protein